MGKKIYESKLDWNKNNVNVSLDRELIDELKLSLGGRQTLKSYIESLIKNNL
jgi:hypothetical protein